MSKGLMDWLNESIKRQHGTIYQNLHNETIKNRAEGYLNALHDLKQYIEQENEILDNVAHRLDILFGSVNITDEKLGTASCCSVHSGSDQECQD